MDVAEQWFGMCSNFLHQTRRAGVLLNEECHNSQAGEQLVEQLTKSIAMRFCGCVTVKWICRGWNLGRMACLLAIVLAGE